MTIGAIIVIIGLLGGGTSAAAESSLPGDALYGIKVNFNEEVRAGIALGAEGKAEWDARRAERRLEETEALAQQGRINAKVKADLEARFAAFASRVEDRIKRLESDGNVRAAADIASRFEASLDAHADVLSRLGEKGNASAGAEADIRPIEVNVRAAAARLTGMRIGLEAKVEAEAAGPEVESAAKGKIGAAENVIASVKSYITREKEALGVSATVDAEAKLKEADDLLVQAKAKLEAKAYGEAFNLGNQAIRAAQEARVRVEQETRYRLNIHFGGNASGTASSSASSSAGGATEVRAGVGAGVGAASGGAGVSASGSIRLRVY